MEYNITNVDKILATKMNTEEGRRIIADLNQNITEQEKQLDLFEKNLTHCKKQIELGTERIQSLNNEIVNCKNHPDSETKPRIELLRTEKEKLKAQKLVFEENMLVWKISGYITLISIDVKTMQKGLYSSQSEWDKRFYARQAYLIMYDAPKSIIKLLEKLYELKGVSAFKSRLRSTITQLKEFSNKNSKYINDVRNNTSGHKDENVLKQIEIIKSINWSDTINLNHEFESIINDMGALLTELINNGLENLEKLFSTKV